MRFLKSNRNSKQDLGRGVFFMLLAMLVLLCVALFERTILNTDFNIFPLIANVILLSLLFLVEEKIERREIYKLLIVGCVVFVFDNIIEVEQWLQSSIFNFYGIMYALYFYTYGRKLIISNSIQKGYVCFINYFLAFYLILFNVAIVLNNFFISSLSQHIKYIDFGIKVIVLFISSLTLLSFIMQRNGFKNLQNKSIISDDLNFIDQEEYNKEISIVTVQELNSNEDVIIAERICDFFESNDSYLHPSFSIGQLCELLSIENTSIVHRVISNNLDTTFYKLVAKYRINYSLELLKSGNNWTLDAVANTSGFKSVNTFKKYFEEYIGLSPFLYRLNSF